jgi:hypothetical protein
MMNKLSCLFVLLLALTVTAGFADKKESEGDLIIKTVSEYVSSWGFCVYKGFANTNMIVEMENAEKAPLKHNPLYITVTVSGVEMLYTENITLLQKHNGKNNKLKPACNKKSEGGLKFSYPVISTDKTSALVMVETSCGAGCGSNEMLVLQKNEFGWVVIKRNILRAK